MSTVITVKQLTKQFRSRGNKHPLSGIWRPEWSVSTAVNDISFRVKRGESVAFLGPNGAGKTTTTKMLCGIIYPTSGTVDVLGFIPQLRDETFLKRIGLVMGNRAGLNWDLTARQSYGLLRHIYEIPREVCEARINELADLLQVSHRLDVQVRRTSLGERMKLELIGALLHNPEILFLDEPTIGLDIEAKRHVRLFLREIQKRHRTTILLTSHDMDDVSEVCDRVMVISQGSLVHDGPLKALEDTYHRDRYVRLHFGGSKRPADKELQSWGEVMPDTNGVLIKIHKSELKTKLSEVLAHDTINDITVESAPLETIIADIFRHARSK